MEQMPPNPLFIYHMTNIDNLPSIAQTGFLLSHNLLNANKLAHTNIAYEQAQNRRHRTLVPCYPFGTLHDYIPFYFAPRSPMLYTINKGNVTGYSGGQKDIVYLVSTLASICEAKGNYVFTDGHPLSAPSCRFFNSLIQLGEVDWNVMRARYWNTPPIVKYKRQAEFLIHNLLSFNVITQIVVCNQESKHKVKQILRANGQLQSVTAFSDWYF